jgi:hypothetical protein
MEPRDFHPGSGGKVQDLIHPSLCEYRQRTHLLCSLMERLDPYMVDSTPLPDTVIQPPTQDGKFITTMEQKHEYQDEDVTMESAYAWIPSIFTVSEDGNDVSIEGYINGLGTREQYPVLFRVVEQVFKIAMPLLERSVWFDTAEIMKDVAMPRESKVVCSIRLIDYRTCRGQVQGAAGFPRKRWNHRRVEIHQRKTQEGEGARRGTG